MAIGLSHQEHGTLFTVYIPILLCGTHLLINDETKRQILYIYIYIYVDVDIAVECAENYNYSLAICGSVDDKAWRCDAGGWLVGGC